MTIPGATEAVTPEQAIAFMTSRISQLRQFIKNRESDITEITKRQAFAREQIASSEQEIASLACAIRSLLPKEEGN